MAKSPSGDSIASLRSRWGTVKRQRLLNKLIGQRCFPGFFTEQDEAEEDPTLIKDLRGANLSARELHDILLMNADMRWVDFTGSRVQGPFQHTNLAHADFTDARLTACRFWRAKLVNCIFERATLEGGSFEGSNLFAASFRDATLTQLRFDACDLTSAVFEGARLQGCVLRGVKLSESDREFWARFGADECRLEEVVWCEGDEAREEGRGEMVAA